MFDASGEIDFSPAGRLRSRTGLLTTALTSLCLAVASVVVMSPGSRADDVAAGTLVTGEAPVGNAGVEVDYTAYLPAGYDDSTDRYPTLYLLHGRGDTMAAWTQVTGDLDELIDAGIIPPVIVVMPDAPWSDRGNYYVDSEYRGSPRGQRVETAMTQDLVGHIDSTFRTVAERDARAVGGYSMGGYGALRYALAHQDLFVAGLVLSPAVYLPLPPDDSSTREFGAFGKRHDLFRNRIYKQKNYPALLPDLDAELPTHLFIAVGDDEWANPDPADADHDLDFEAARLYNRVRRSPAITAEFRVLDGGHGWDTWQPAFREGIQDLMGYVRTTPPQPLVADLIGTSGDDRAGGIAVLGDDVVIGANLAGPIDGVVHQGGSDAVVIRRAVDGTTRWATSVATPEADRLYGVEVGADGAVHAAGYTSGNIDGAHPDTSSNDAFAVQLDADGVPRWTVQFGDADEADRIYGTGAAAAGGMLVTGYTKGSVDGTPNLGDKDAFVARIAADGQVEWIRQLGGSGEDKGLAVAESATGEVFVAGVASAGIGGTTGRGGLDGFLAKYDATGTIQWVQQVGTSEVDQLSGVVADAAGGVVVAGHTAGTLGEDSAGGIDAFAMAVDADGTITWTTQDGSLGDDRVADVEVDTDGSLVVAGHTDGRIGVSSGGVDVFLLRMDPSGTVSGRDQVGTPDRDGADIYDEANLWLAVDGGSIHVSGLTFGSTASASNAGEGDIFVGVVDDAEGDGGIDGQ